MARIMSIRRAFCATTAERVAVWVERVAAWVERAVVRVEMVACMLLAVVVSVVLMALIQL